MRPSSLLVLVSSLCLLAAFGVRSQELEIPDEDDTIEPSGARPEPARTVGSKTQIQEEHTITPGDTLWDLCARYLNNPWYWPRVWSYNPEITNPHWIYPGQMVRFFPSGELPSELDIVVSRDLEVPEPVDGDLGDEAVPMAKMVQFSDGRSHVKSRPLTAMRILRAAFVSKEEMEDVGVLRSAREEVEFLSDHDTIYLEFKNLGQAQVGQQYTIFRTAEEVEHPITEELIGYQTQVLGTCEVVAMNDNLVSAIIVKTLEPIQRGDRVAPLMPELSREVTPTANSVEVRGYIVGAEVTQLTMYGENHLVFIDQGTEQGVQEGNVFDVVRREDGLFMPGEGKEEGKWDKKIPAEIWGRIMVVDARRTASTGVVIASLRELRRGDRVLMSVQ
jgi:hypothetical protein